MKNIDFSKIVCKDYKIIVDTSSLLQNSSEYVFFKIIAPLLHQYNKKLIIPKSVYNEIYKHSKNKKIKNIAKSIRILNEFAKYDLYVIEKTFDTNFADNAIISLFLSIRLKYNLCLITNDNSMRKGGNLSQDILDLKKSRSVQRIKDIKVFYLHDNNILDFTSKKQAVINNNRYIFKLPKKPITGELKQVLSTKFPTTGCFIYDDIGNKYKLIKQLGREGGEGIVYLTNKANYVCKIYKENKNTNFKKEKIQLLIKNKTNVKNVCFPEIRINNHKGEFIGYLMKKAEGVEIKTSIFIPALLKKKLPSWNRFNLAKLSLDILKTVKNLHNKNIILGDINPSNILVTSKNKLFFIDTDSYQIDAYPCPVGMIPYTRVLNHGKKYSEYLRTKDDDIFAVVTLIFQILLPGKLPYSFCGGGSERDNMNPKNFSYQCYDGKGYDNPPAGQWVFIWSHLPRKLKKNIFCGIFKENKKISLNEIIEEMESYLYQLENKYQVNLIFPSSFKPKIKHKQYT